ncbi:MAG: dihydrofolate reductase [Cytophagaceae bacterium]|nr:dihydrofolate reductase [Gemmatimonadaceae bacterium]
MPRISSFFSASLDGFFADEKDDVSWTHDSSGDPEWSAFVSGNASGDGQLLMGRKTYEMMRSYWPTPAAKAAMPVVAEGMNRMPKHVASRTLTEATWNNTHLISGDLLAAVRRLKAAPGPDIATLGSGSIVSQLAQAGLVDEFQVVTIPILLGNGRHMFGDIPAPLRLRTVRSRAFTNGHVVTWYAPA